MRLATIRTAAGHRAVRVDDGAAVETGDADVRALLTHPDWRGAGRGCRRAVARARHRRLRPARARPREDHLRGAELPRPRAGDGQPAARVPHRLRQVRARADRRARRHRAARVSDKVDWEAELTVVIGTPVRHADAAAAEAAIAGYTVMNDVSVRDFQNRTKQFLQGKTFEHSTPLGPHLVTPDELPAGRLGHRHHARRRDRAELLHRPARVRRGRAGRVPVARSSR